MARPRPYAPTTTRTRTVLPPVAPETTSPFTPAPVAPFQKTASPFTASPFAPASASAGAFTAAPFRRSPFGVLRAARPFGPPPGRKGLDRAGKRPREHVTNIIWVPGQRRPSSGRRYGLPMSEIVRVYEDDIRNLRPYTVGQVEDFEQHASVSAMYEQYSCGIDCDPEQYWCEGRDTADESGFVESSDHKHPFGAARLPEHGDLMRWAGDTDWWAGCMGPDGIEAWRQLRHELFETRFTLLPNPEQALNHWEGPFLAQHSLAAVGMSVPSGKAIEVLKATLPTSEELREAFCDTAVIYYNHWMHDGGDEIGGLFEQIEKDDGWVFTANELIYLLFEEQDLPEDDQRGARQIRGKWVCAEVEYHSLMSARNRHLTTEDPIVAYTTALMVPVKPS